LLLLALLQAVVFSLDLPVLGVADKLFDFIFIFNGLGTRNDVFLRFVSTPLIIWECDDLLES